MNTTNTKLEKARTLLKSALAGVEAELQQPSELYQYLVACCATPGESPSDEAHRHLHDTQKELARMFHEVETGQIDRWHQQHSWVGRITVDGWPLKHPLTNLVLKAESAYLKT